MKKLTKLGQLGLTVSLLLSPVASNADTLLGVYYGNQGWAMDEVTELENWQGKKHAVINLFTGWTEESESLLFTYQLNNIWNHGSVPLITWEPHLSGETPETIETDIATGEYDTYINSWANNLKIFLSGMDGEYGTADDRRAYIRLAHEANGNWYPWSAEDGVNTPADYIAMWRRIRNQFDQLGLDQNHLQWIWTVSASDAGAFTAEDYYPGEAYVDWVGIDGFNWGSDYYWSYWRTPETIFENMRLRTQFIAPGKPLAIPEVASTSNDLNVVDTTAKETWITQFADYIDYAGFGLVSWFNQDKEADWQIFAGDNGATTVNSINVYPAYKTLVQNTDLLAANDNNLRIITDSQFKGDFDDTTDEPLIAKQCQLNYQVTQQWTGGYVANVTVDTNYLLAKNWELAFEFSGDGEVNYGWNAVLTQNADTVSVTPPSWWQWVAADRTPAFGFVGKGLPDTPFSASLNGKDCTVNILG